MIAFDLTDEQKQLRETARDFTAQEIIPVAGRYDEAEEFPTEVLRKAWDVGLMNLEIPVEYGGVGLGVLDAVVVMEEINFGCSGVGTIMTANGLASTPLLIAGSEEQKQRFLGSLCSDFKFAGYALTEPGSGSDVAGMTTRYKRDGDHFVLDGVKHFITNGTEADWFTVFATRDASERHGGIACFVVPADTPGVTTTKMTGKLGQRCSDTAEISFDQVRVPLDALVGNEGEGFRIAMQTFDRTRPQIGPMCIGIARRALEESRDYALERKQFGEPIANFQAIQFMLADMAIEVEAMRLLTWKAAWSIDQGEPASIVASYAKAFGADRTMQIAINAVQIFGGYGYMKEYPVEKLMRDAKLLQIYEGTSQIQRMVIARNLLKK